MINIFLQDTLFSGIIERMRSSEPWGAPKGAFYQLSGDIAPYIPRPTIFRIETDRVNEPVEIQVEQSSSPKIGVDPRKDPKVITTVATSDVFTIGIQLGRGLNKITARVLDREDEVAYINVRATTIVAWWEAFARVLFSGTLRIINEQRRAISSKLATRLIEPFVDFQDLLPDIQSLQILSYRFITRGMIHNVGTESGVNDLLKALTLTNPIYKDMDKDTFELYPALDPWTKAASQFGGREAHVWISNVAVAKWLTFLHYIANQPDIFEVVSISEDEVVVRYQGQLQRHRFQFDLFGTDFITALARSECFKSIVINISMHSELLIRICAASYTFDLFLTEETPIGNDRFSFDQGIPFDMGLKFDSDPVDPFSDGWAGLSLTGRFEQDSNNPHCLDTFVMPSTAYTGADCCYESYYTQLVANQRYDVDVDASNVTTTGTVITALLFTLESPDTTRWDISVTDLGELVATSGSVRSPDTYKVERPDTTEVTFAITNTGEVQVVEPVLGGETLVEDLVLRSPSFEYWELTVLNDNTIQTVEVI